MIPEKLTGKIIRLPSGAGNDYFRVIAYNELFQELLLYKLSVQVTDTGVIELARSALAISPTRQPIAFIKSLPVDLTTPVELALPPATSMMRVSLTKKQEAQYEKDMDRLVQITNIEKIIFYVYYRNYRAYIEEQDGDRMTLTRALGRYFQFGMDVHKAAMAALFRDRRRTNARTVEKKLGRKRKLVKSGHAPHLEGINANESHRSSIALYLKQTSDRYSKGPSELYNDFKNTFIDRKVGTLSDGTPLMEPDPAMAITLSQFKYALIKLESFRQREVMMVSKAKWNKDRRALIGTARDGVRYPGQLYIIDSTIADVYLVSAMDGKILVGRPVIYVIIDAFSSLILSIHVTVDTANADQAKVALYRAVTSKDAWLKSLNAPHEFGVSLPAGCKPTAVFCDRGELLSKAGVEMAKTMNVALRLAAPYRADWKSLVERFFGIINDKVLHWMPGGVRARAIERGERDVRYDGVLSIHGLQRVMLSLAAEWNETHNMSKHISASMLRQEIKATPIEFWKYGLKVLHPAAEWFDRQDAIRQLLPPIESILNRRGAELHEGIRFTADWMETDDRYFEQRKAGRANMLLDPDDPLGAYLIDDQCGELRQLKLVDTRNYADHDVTAEDIRVIESYTALRSEEEKHDNRGIVSTHEGFRRSEIRTAGRKAKADKMNDTRSLANQVGNIHGAKAAALLGPIGIEKTASNGAVKTAGRSTPFSTTVMGEFDSWDGSIF